MSFIRSAGSRQSGVCCFTPAVKGREFAKGTRVQREFTFGHSWLWECVLLTFPSFFTLWPLLIVASKTHTRTHVWASCYKLQSPED